METKYYKTFFGVVKGINEEEHTLDVYVSTPTIDRDNEIIKLDAWDVKEFLKNPVLIDSHNYTTVQNIIGKILDISSDNKGLAAKIKYFVGEGNEKADWAYALAKNGIAAFSVGFIPVKKEQGQGQVRTVYTKVKLLEISQVPVPANPEAVINNSAYIPVIKSFREVNNSEMGLDEEVKGVIPFKKHPLADPNAKWDAGKEVKEATPEQLKEMCAWYDASKPDVKSSYKLPHHYVKNYVTVWKGVAAAMAALLGARGGVNIPDKDRKGVYNHLAKHYEEFGKKPPEFKEYESEEEILKACGIEKKDVAEVIALGSLIDHLDFLISAFEKNNVNADDVNKMRQALALLMEVMQSQAVLGRKEFLIEKSGRVISEANRKKIQNAIEALKSAESALTELLQISETATNSSPIDEKKQSKDIVRILKELEEALAV